MIYSIPRGENVIARIWKKGKYDYILLVNMDRKKEVVKYTFTKPSNKTCIQIMSGVNKKDITQNKTNSKVTINIPKIGVVWLRGFDSKKACDKVDEIDPKTLKIRGNSHTFAIVFSIILIICIGGIVFYLFFTKKLCFRQDFKSKDIIKDIKKMKLLNY